MPKQMHLALDVSWTQVESAWRMPGSWVGRHYPDVGLFEDIARIAERGLFDMICAAAPYVMAMTRRLRRERDFREEPANIFRFPD